ncbi:hypothetical protein AAG906_014922 [Vitis piasezkii]
MRGGKRMTSLVPWRGGGLDHWIGSPFSSELWDPLGFGSRDWRRGRDDDVSAVALACVDWRETNNAHIIRADLPGVRKEDVKVQVEDGNMLQISGEKTKEKEESGERWHRIERQRGSFLRRFRLPENANTEGINCALENGVLTVTVPKKEATSTGSDVKQIDIA